MASAHPPGFDGVKEPIVALLAHATAEVGSLWVVTVNVLAFTPVECRLATLHFMVDRLVDEHMNVS